MLILHYFIFSKLCYRASDKVRGVQLCCLWGVLLQYPWWSDLKEIGGLHILQVLSILFFQTRSDQNQNLQGSENVLATLLPPPPYRTSHLRVLILTFSLMWILKIWRISLMWGLVNTAIATTSPKSPSPPISPQHQSSAAAASLHSLSLSSLWTPPTS